MAKSKSDYPTTQRAYTLRLRGANPEDHSWRDALWETHVAVNKGTKVFGDWLLTLRGGLDHTLASEPLVTDADIEKEWKTLKKNKDKKQVEPSRDDAKRAAEEKRKSRIQDKRILLALSWLSVESEKGAPDTQVVPHDLDKQSGTRSNWKTVEALKEILKKRGLDGNEVSAWVQDCAASLTAAIRVDAAWVNRSQAFDEVVKSIGCSFTPDEVWDMLERFFGSKDAYLVPANLAKDKAVEMEQEDKAKDLVQKAGQWLSSRFGTGKGADFSRMAEAYNKIAEWAGKGQSGITGDKAIADLAVALRELGPASNDLQGVLSLISGPGYKSATRNFLNQLVTKTSVTQQDFQSLLEKATDDEEKCRANTGSKGQRPYADAILKDAESACGFTYLQDGGPARHSEFAVMLDHAARRVSLAHAWIKRAEAERRRFEEDANRIANVPTSAKAWLDAFCLERSGASGALEPYRIRRRAIDGWDKIMRAWAKCTSEQERTATAGTVQAECQTNDEKFGDIQLFEALADNDALCVWHKDGDCAKVPDSQYVIDYVFATDAEFKKRRFKVPAYRHPDALLHPVFCDFGESRWDIKYAIHQVAIKGGKKTKNKGVSGENGWLKDRYALCMGLWDGQKLDKNLTLRWSCKRLTKNMALRQVADTQEMIDVSRADRLGRAAAGAKDGSFINILKVFQEELWNGRLQAPRSQLNAIAARVAEHGWDAKAKQMRDRLHWLITFSAKLQPFGPWIAYAEGFPDDAIAKPFVSGKKGEYAIKHQTNDKRQGHAKLILSRLPGLRVLSVDLGHRYAAACAVWETLTTEQVRDACQSMGHDAPKESDLYLHLKKTVMKQRKDKEVEVEETTVYRRIGADTLIDGSPHPAPWARLDRQFLIKLQGEDREARRANSTEIGAVQELERTIGRESPERRSLRVDELMSDTVHTVRLALQRHSRRARIAYNFTASTKLLPGGREETLTEEGRIELLADTLADWCALHTDKGWIDEWAKQQWETHVRPWLQGAVLPPMPGDDETTAKARKKYRIDLTEKLKTVAANLAQNDSLRRELHCLWASRWRDDDVILRKHLRRLRDWILPRGKKAEADRAIRYVGGLSLTRIATIKSLYQVQKAFHMRAEPDDPRKNIPTKGDDALQDFGRSILDVMEHMREQRVKQLASRIAEAALGIGRVKIPNRGKMPKRPCTRVDRSCHAVVIENLTRYRPEETRTRRENRQLMSWSSSKVKKYLAEACQLHGLHLREVQAGYTSRQDSRTGAPGDRCCDVPVEQFLSALWWKRAVNTAKEKVRSGKGNAREIFLADLDEKWSAASKDQRKTAPPIRIPVAGGEIFVSSDRSSPASKGLQADLNAAANIGLRALLDPDWPGKWWYVPCSAKDGKPLLEKVKGAACIDPAETLYNPTTKSDTKDRGKQKNEIMNIWRDPAGIPINGVWEPTAIYWNQVRARVIEVLKIARNSGDDNKKKKLEVPETPW